MTDHLEDPNPTPQLQPVADWKRQMMIITVIGIGTVLATISWFSLNGYLALACALAHAALAYRMNTHFAHKMDCSLCGSILDPYEHCAPCWTNHVLIANEHRTHNQPSGPPPPY